jgi:hypothetical protein
MTSNLNFHHFKYSKLHFISLTTTPLADLFGSKLSKFLGWPQLPFFQGGYED